MENKRNKPEKFSSEDDLFKFLEKIPPGIWSIGFKKGGIKKEKLSELIHTYWRENIESSKPVSRIAFGLRLILTFPTLVQRPLGFEWIVDDLEACLIFFKEDFWKATKKVQTSLKKRGRPPNENQDHMRFYKVYALMKKGMSKTKAIEEVAQIEGDRKEEGGSMDSRKIQRSLDRIIKQAEISNDRIKKFLEEEK